ncbi:MAG: hypothetical protein H6974_14220 [Gammaproteobacteria bacterium]|nr:hypothetical protein [Gammaproteobacteria bacterium]
MSDFDSWVRSLSQSDVGFGTYYLTMGWVGKHYLHIVQILAKDGRFRDLQALATCIRTTKPAVFIKQLQGHCPAGLITALKKLPKRHLHWGNYQRLLTLFNEPNAAKTLQHATSIRPTDLEILEALDLKLRNLGLLKQLRKREEVKELNTYIHGLSKTCRGLTLSDIQKKIIHHLPKSDDIQEAVWRVLAEHAHFPEAPWNGDECLIPITDARMLISVSREFQNCLRNYLDETLRRECVFYVYRASNKKVVIRLTWDLLLGWVIDEMLGYRNVKPSRQTESDIVARFASAGIEVKPSHCFRDRYFGGFEDDLPEDNNDDIRIEDLLPDIILDDWLNDTIEI